MGRPQRVKIAFEELINRIPAGNPRYSRAMPLPVPPACVPEFPHNSVVLKGNVLENSRISREAYDSYLNGQSHLCLQKGVVVLGSFLSF